MAIQPTRPSGSTQTLIFTGDLVLGSANKQAIPSGAASTRNGVVPANIGNGDKVGIRFLLADSSDLTNLATKLPSHVFDDSQPAGVAPHAATTGSTTDANIYLVTDNVITARTWAQNLEVTVAATNETDAALLTNVDYSGIQVVLDDDTDSGLGLQSGLPVVIIPMTFDQAFGAWAAVSVRVSITVRDTASR
jgi:hypothetical protein